MKAQTLTECHLVYGDLAGQLVFIPKDTAERLAYLWRALGWADTWGEFLRMLEACPALLDQFAAHWQECCDTDSPAFPPADSPFDPEQIPGHVDGDWPAWPAQDMLRWMPWDLQKAWGRRVASNFNGDFLELDGGDESALVASLTQRGFCCVKDSELVRRACGH